MTNPTGEALNKQSSAALSTLAARVLQGYVPTAEETRSLAASVLSQDATKGQGKGKGRKSVQRALGVVSTAVMAAEFVDKKPDPQLVKVRDMLREVVASDAA